MANCDTIINVNKDILILYSFLNKIVKSNDNSNCMDPSSIINVFNLIYEGSAGKSRRNLRKSNLIDMIKLVPKSTRSRSGVFIKENYTFDRVNFIKEMNSQNHILDFIPTTTSNLEKVNKKIDKKHPGWDENFFTELPSNTECRVCVKNQSYFDGKWKYPFDWGKTRPSFFYIGHDDAVRVQFMTGPDHYILSHENEKLDSLFVSFPYKNGDSMLIMMPRKPLNKSKLFQLYFRNFKLLAESITDFYYSKGKYIHYSDIYLPKFEFETVWEFNNNYNDDDDGGDCSIPKYLKTIMDPEINLGNICREFQKASPFESVTFQSISKITNNELGTLVKTKTGILYEEGEVDTNILKINRGFLFVIVDKKYTISKVGVFVGK